jgi:hypothetical protein
MSVTTIIKTLAKMQHQYSQDIVVKLEILKGRFLVRGCCSILARSSSSMNIISMKNEEYIVGLNGK